MWHKGSCIQIQHITPAKWLDFQNCLPGYIDFTNNRNQFCSRRLVKDLLIRGWADLENSLVCVCVCVGGGPDILFYFFFSFVIGVFFCFFVLLFINVLRIFIEEQLDPLRVRNSTCDFPERGCS